MTTFGELVEEVRARGVHVTVRAGAGRVGPMFVMHETGAWSAEFAAEIRGVLSRGGMTESAEGLWLSAGAPPGAAEEVTELLRADDEAARAL